MWRCCVDYEPAADTDVVGQVEGPGLEVLLLLNEAEEDGDTIRSQPADGGNGGDGVEHISSGEQRQQKGNADDDRHPQRPHGRTIGRQVVEHIAEREAFVTGQSIRLEQNGKKGHEVDEWDEGARGGGMGRHRCEVRNEKA